MGTCDRAEAMEAVKTEEEHKQQRLVLECRLEVMEAAVQKQEGLAAHLTEESQAAEKAAEEFETELKALDEQRKQFVGRIQAVSAAGRGALNEASEVAQQAIVYVQKLVGAEEANVQVLSAKIRVADKATDAANKAMIESGNAAMASGKCNADAEGSSSERRLAEAKEARATAEKQLAEGKAKVLQLQGVWTTALAALASRDDKLGVLASTVVHLEKQLEEAKRNTAMEVHVQQQTKRQALSTASKFVVPVHKPARLFVVSHEVTELAGEYRLLRDLVSKRPAYGCRGSNNEDRQTVYLFWREDESRCAWAFGRQLPSAGKEGSAIGASSNAEVSQSIIAQCLQQAWTALPDELSSKWQAGAATVNITAIAMGSRWSF